VDHSQYDDAFASPRQRLDGVSDDVGKSTNRFFVGSRNTAWSPSGHLPETFSSRIYSLQNCPRGHRIVRRDICNS